MQSENEKDSFTFTYSAKEQEELKKIRSKYQPDEESKMDRLRRLDSAVTHKATLFSISTGVIGALIMGLGMSLAMTDLGKNLGLTEAVYMTFGIVIGIIGIIFLCFAYPIYNYFVKKEREKIAPEIIKLTDELLR